MGCKLDHLDEREKSQCFIAEQIVHGSRNLAFLNNGHCPKIVYLAVVQPMSGHCTCFGEVYHPLCDV